MEQNKSVFPVVQTDGVRHESDAMDITSVTIKDGFWHAYQKLVVCSILPHILEQIEPENYQNVLNSARRNRDLPYNPYNGRQYFGDSFVYETAESMAWALMLDSQGDKEIENAQLVLKDKLLQWIPNLENCLTHEGYMGSQWVLGANPPHRPQMYDVAYAHEMYNMAMYMDAAIAVHRALGSDEMLKASLRNIDYLTETIGEGAKKKRMVPGHPVIEGALLRMADYCECLAGEYLPYVQKCRDFSTWLLLNRGTQRDWYGTQQTNWNVGLKPLHKLVPADIQGQHTDRAGYLYQAMADWGKLNKDTRYDQTLLTLYQSVVSSRIYITGGSGYTGASGEYAELEAWGAPYVLPNDLDKCCETCSAMTLIFWSKSMHHLFGDGGYYDIIERALYNTTLAQVDLDGQGFFYHQLLQSKGAARKRWLGVPCCPVNLTRLLPNLGRYLYSRTDHSLLINMYVSSQCITQWHGKTVKLLMESDMPWLGKAKVSVRVEEALPLTVRLRVPGWCTGQAKVLINNYPVTTTADHKGYLNITRTWSDGDEICVDFPMDAFRVYTPQVKTNDGLVALQHGPVVYCAEAADNIGASLDALYLPAEAQIYTKEMEKLPHGVGLYGPGRYETDRVVMLSADARIVQSDREINYQLKLIPYYAWANRAYGPMRIFIKEKP